VSIFSGYLLRDCPDEGEVSRFLLSGGILTAILMFDDLLLLHEQLLPNRLYIPQNVVLASYALMTAAFLMRFPRFIIQHTNAPGLLLALGLFSVSVVVDLFSTRDRSELTVGNALWALGEDGTKLLGIVGWAAYFLGMSLQAVRRRTRLV